MGHCSFIPLEKTILKTCLRLSRGNLSRAGFTLVEIMIVVAIIAMLSAILIPNLLHARLNSNESIAQGTLKTIAQACESFRAVQVFPQYPANLAAITGSIPPYISDVVDTATTGVPKNGYNFTFTLIGFQQYVCCAAPQIYRQTGTRTFAINESGILRAIDNNSAAVISEAGYEAMIVIQ